MPAPRSHHESIYNVDASWLHMDTPNNSVAITGLYLFDQPMDFARARETLRCRLLRFPRFVQRVKEPLVPFTLPRWEVDPCFDLDAHLHRVALPAPGDWQALMQLVEDLMRIPLHPDRPLWQMYIVDNVGSGSALIGRLSHAMADGYALMRVLKATTDDCADIPPDRIPYSLEEDLEGEPSFLVDTILQAFDRVDNAVNLSKSAFKGSLGLLRHPSRLVGLAGLGASSAMSLGKLLLIPPDRRTSLRGQCGVAKRAVASDPLSLAEIKRIGKTLGGTVNDVLLSGVTAGFRRYLLANGESIGGASVRAMVPVYIKDSKKAMEADASSGNGFGLVYLELPVGVEDSLERLSTVHANMGSLKRSMDAPVAYGILYSMGPFPKPLTRTISGLFGLKATAVMTNVPGPQERLYFAGAKIDRVMFWVPQPAGLAVGVSIMSYAGEVIIGLATDAALIPDPEIILDGFHSEFHELRLLAEQVAE